MGKCKDCKFWKRTTEEDDHINFNNTHLGNCICDKFLKGYSLEISDIPKDGVWVEDDEGWSFYAGEEFGCIHFINTG